MMKSSPTVISPSINDAVNYCSGKFGESWTDDHLLEEILRSIHENSMLYSLTDEGHIEGIVTARIFETSRVCHVVLLAADNLRIVCAMMNKFLLMYPGWTLQGERHKIFRVFRAINLAKKLYVHSKSSI